MDCELVVLVPALGRPGNVQPLLASLAEATTVPHHVLYLLSPGDYSMRDLLMSLVGFLSSQRLSFAAVPWEPGSADWARKINWGYRKTTEPFIFTGADDLKFYPGWWEAARRWFEDPHIGVVGTNDLGNPAVRKGYHSTHSLVRRDYADRMGTVDGPGAILSEAYPHEWSDNELVETARARHAYVQERASHVEHLHAHWGKAPEGTFYAAPEGSLEEGRRIFKERKRLWERQLPRYLAKGPMVSGR